MEISDALAKAYFEKFLVRAEILEEFQKRKAYSDVIREGQEALELFTKGLLRCIGVEPTHSHDPGKELLPVRKNVPPPFFKRVDEIAEWSRKLRKDRELSFCGARDFVPTQEYSSDEALSVIRFLNSISKDLKKFIKDH